MFDFGHANDAQREAIRTVEGPLLITAGPGTGKTFTLVRRALYLIQECGAAPENILMATFTEKAAKELVTRITNELDAAGVAVNINDMYIGTFHSICLRILKEHLEYTRLKKNYRLLDDFDQPFTIFRHFREFAALEDFDMIFPRQRMAVWQRATDLAGRLNKLEEEMVDVAAMLTDERPEVRALARAYQCYAAILEEDNLIDFSTIQTECYRLLTEHPEVLAELQAKVRYMMIDEYQDTNYIQEQLVFLLGGQSQNICVVGDDDQGLYRFRGATIRNILEFPGRFPDGVCQRVTLATNYRSQKDIVDFYNAWMQTTEGDGFAFSWGGCRFDKTIVPFRADELPSATAVRLETGDEDAYCEQVLALIERLRDAGRITDYNQLAFLFRSVKNPHVRHLARYLEAHGVSVYSPRADNYFDRQEIRLLIGCLLLVFPRYLQRLQAGDYSYLREELVDYYVSCEHEAAALIQEDREAHRDLLTWLRQHGLELMQLEGTTDYSFSNLVYELCSFEPFRSIVDTEVNTGVADLRPVQNLAHFTQIVGKFEYLYRINVFNSEYLERDVEDFFNTYLRFLQSKGVNEHEDEKEYAPSGCVSFLTIHQSKGMEFPIVIVGSLSSVPRQQCDALMDGIAARYYHREPFEPADDIKYFDFWRLYYTAFSRAQDLLVLAYWRGGKSPSKYFREILGRLPSVNSDAFHPEALTFQPVKESHLKDSFSFTSQISVYEACARQYKLYKELEFMPVRESAMVFGTLVHETIEDVHRAALRHEEGTIDEAHLHQWFDTNYNSLVKREHAYLDRTRLEAAFRQVARYVERQHGDWSHIRDAEVEVSLVRPDYIIDGQIDLVRGENGSVELIDFKSERKPELNTHDERLEHYRRQLHLYAYLIEQKTGQHVSRMHLYYTGEEQGSPLVTFPYSRTAIEGTVAAFDDTVQHILAKDFDHEARSPRTCQNCDFRMYCGKR